MANVNVKKYVVNRERAKVHKEVASIHLEDDTLEGALDTIQRLINDYGADAKIEKTYYPYSNSESQYLGVFIQVDETDDQMNLRIVNEERWAEEAKKRDLAQYEALKKQFEG